MKRTKLLPIIPLSLLLAVALILIGWAPVALAAPTAQSTEPTGLAVVISGASLYDTPDGDVIHTLASGTMVTATGRDETGTWIRVETSDASIGASTGWLQTSRLIGVGLESLNVVDPAASAGNTADAPTADTTVSSTATAVQGQSAVVRAGGATLMNGSDMSQLAAGTLLIVESVSTDGTWYSVRVDDGTSGWVSSSDLLVSQSSASASNTNTATATGSTATGSTATAATVLATIDTGYQRLNVRSGPDTSYAIIANANSGESYPVLARDSSGDWLQLQLGNSAADFGWGSASYVTLEGDISELEVSDAVNDASSVTPSITPSITAVSLSASSANTDLATMSIVDESTATAASSRIVFSSDGTIYLIDLADGIDSEQRSLGEGWDPALSPDGESVLAVQAFDGQWEIVRIDIADGRVAQLTQGTAGVNSGAPQWSPDGSEILYLNDSSGTWQLWRMTADGSDPSALTSDGLSDIDIEYDPTATGGADWR